MLRIIRYPLPTKATRVPTISLSSTPVDLVLHIGTMKTGSTVIQYVLRDNREKLAELGCLYPMTPGTRPRRFRLGLLLKSDADLVASAAWRRQRLPEPTTFRKDFRRQLAREIEQSGLSRVLLSDESLYHQPDAAALRRLRRLTDELATSLRLVVYLRRQDDHVISRYQQRVKGGVEVRRIDEFVRHDASMPYDYDARLRTWERILEPAEFAVRRFEKDSFPNGSLIQDFLRAADVNVGVEDMAQIPHHNESLDAESVEFLRLLNLYRVEREGVPLSLVRELATKSPYHQPVEINNSRMIARLREVPAGPLLTLPDHVLDEFMAQWEASNRTVAQRYLGDPSGELFRMPRRTHHTTTEQRLDPARLDYYLNLVELPEQVRGPFRKLVEREAKATGASFRRTRATSRLRSIAVAGTVRFTRKGADSAAKSGATRRA